MAKYDWFEEWKSEDKTEDPAVHGEPFLEGWSGFLIFVIAVVIALINTLWKPAIAIGAVWLGYESISAIVEYVQGVL